MNNNTVDFYLGANSQDGFVSYFSEFENPYNDYISYIIKGGPGTGKSGLMKKMAASFNEEVLSEYIHCSSDPDSLDGIFLHESKLTFCDGTPPHVIEPQYPGAFERIINLLDAFDNESLQKSKQDIVKYSLMISAQHSKYCNLLKCINVLREENIKVLKTYVDKNKLKKTVKSTLKQVTKNKRGSGAKLNKRLLSAFTPQGVVTYTNSIDYFCDTVYSLEDKYDVITHDFMSMIRDILLSANYECYVCYNPLSPADKISHIIVPELKIGFISQNKYVKVTPQCEKKTINYTRFINKENLQKHKHMLKFNEKAIAPIVEEMLAVMKKAKELHDVLEGYYTPNVDFKLIDEKYKKLLAHIKK